ncbi:DUF2635 domain-containing protein [Roseomonas indoligenes]|uniref:DUF2635 domain-containing protein n=1 Tax=Roseomonas indoligenes TaxID=2820811 RepID=A0A940MYQ9_9PROT|nr:DUF2635 domain-containing protein [Pararoseomonas indoligenes]MBP0492170.1 DUF2635 domain-containing protein [Pararoseomonas indoligenes]
MLVKPAKGLAVRDPELNDALPSEGRDVPRNEYWLRRIAEGDVREVEEKPAKPAEGTR